MAAKSRSERLRRRSRKLKAHQHGGAKQANNGVERYGLRCQPPAKGRGNDFYAPFGPDNWTRRATDAGGMVLSRY